MGKLQTVVTLPKRILLQGWANDENSVNINGEYTYTINFDISIIQGGPSILYNGYKHNTLNAFIYFIGEACEFSYLCNWEFLTTADPNQWDNPSTNPNVLPLNGWIQNNAQGPAGIITILENISGKNNKISIKKQNLGGGKMSLYKTPPKFLPFGVPLLVTNLPFDENGQCNFSFFNKTWIYLGAPTFRYRIIDSPGYFIKTPLTPEGYGGNGSYEIADSDAQYFTNNYNSVDKFPSDNWQLGGYVINTCSQYTTVPIFSLS
jgi:hypothetical protein